MTKSLVSIIVPNYNSEQFIVPFIQSVLSQTYAFWELIIIDDGSTDSSVRIIEECSHKDSRIKLLKRQDDNKGACQRRNQGFKAAKGEFICFFDSDDLLPEDTIEIRVKEIKKDPNLDFVVVPAISFDKRPFDRYLLALGLPLFKDDLAMFLKRYRLPFGVWTNIYRRSFLESNNIEWDERLTSLQDSDYNIQCLSIGAKYKYADCSAPGYFWRISGNPNSITKKIKTQKNLDSQLYFYQKLLEKFGATKYKNDVERFGLTLLNRFALCQAKDEPTILFSKFGRKAKFKILRFIYRSSTLQKLSPLINLLFSPLSIINEYLFLISNRKTCGNYIRYHVNKGILEQYTDFEEKKNLFHTYIRIDDFNGLRSFLDDHSKEGDWIFRGLSEAKYKIYSSAQRHWIMQDEIVQANYETSYNGFIEGIISKMKSSDKLMEYLAKHDIPCNDFLLLSILQHYKEISPLVDFTLDPYMSLYFAADDRKTLDGGLGDYISIYFAASRIDWISCTIQNINLHGASRADDMVAEFERNNGGRIDCRDIVNGMKNLTYNEYKDLLFLPVAGPEIGIVNVKMPYLGFEWTYNNTNPRIESQKGFFILNTSSSIPLIERANEQTKYPIFGCVEIHKRLIPEIKDFLSREKHINDESVYPRTQDSRELEGIINSLFQE